MPFYIYILRTSGNTLYTGLTNDLTKRILQHKNKSKKSAKYLRRFTSFQLVYSERAANKNDALRRELEIKSWSKKKKEDFIKNRKKVK